jgi:hypothetical protein
VLIFILQWRQYTWAQLRVSDLIRIRNGETFPAGSANWGLGFIL